MNTAGNLRGGRERWKTGVQRPRDQEAKGQGTKKPKAKGPRGQNAKGPRNQNGWFIREAEELLNGYKHQGWNIVIFYVYFNK